MTRFTQRATNKSSLFTIMPMNASINAAIPRSAVIIDSGLLVDANSGEIAKKINSARIVSSIVAGRQSPMFANGSFSKIDPIITITNAIAASDV